MAEWWSGDWYESDWDEGDWFGAGEGGGPTIANLSATLSGNGALTADISSSSARRSSGSGNTACS
jgi:hypothetical protein